MRRLLIYAALAWTLVSATAALAQVVPAPPIFSPKTSQGDGNPFQLALPLSVRQVCAAITFASPPVYVALCVLSLGTAIFSHRREQIRILTHPEEPESVVERLREYLSNGIYDEPKDRGISNQSGPTAYA
jgi:hypothetical protein